MSVEITSNLILKITGFCPLDYNESKKFISFRFITSQRAASCLKKLNEYFEGKIDIKQDITDKRFLIIILEN